MTASVADHYANHLAPIYSWMVGDFENACATANKFYSSIELPCGSGTIAVDLGCGHGVHAVPLAGRGYQVLAIDTSSHLLSELDTIKGDLPIKLINDDLTGFGKHLGSDSPSLIACMGDTLTHLSSVDAVNALIHESARRLSRDGLMVFGFRDYTNELKETDRLIPVRSDEDRIHTCFLEYHSETVLVHDILHTRIDSAWKTSVSAYTKIRLCPNTFVVSVSNCGFSLIYDSTDRGMHYFVFKRSLPQTAG
ncbi:MAG: methyltransferase domain-containing protein [Planctomycetota bacterium]